MWNILFIISEILVLGFLGWKGLNGSTNNNGRK